MWVWPQVLVVGRSPTPHPHCTGGPFLALSAMLRERAAWANMGEGPEGAGGGWGRGPSKRHLGLNPSLGVLETSTCPSAQNIGQVKQGVGKHGDNAFDEFSCFVTGMTV